MKVMSHIKDICIRAKENIDGIGTAINLGGLYYGVIEMSM